MRSALLVRVIEVPDSANWVTEQTQELSNAATDTSDDILEIIALHTLLGILPVIHILHSRRSPPLFSQQRFASKKRRKSPPSADSVVVV
jgi:hypothetical protein